MADTDPDVFLPEIDQLRFKLRDLDEMVSTERLTTNIIDSLLAERYLMMKFQATRNSASSFEQIQLMKTTFIDHSETISVTENNQESHRRGRGNGQESAMK